MSTSPEPDHLARDTLRLLGPAPDNWVPAHAGIDHDVAIVGGGQSGTAYAFALRRAGIARTASAIDFAALRGKTVRRLRPLPALPDALRGEQALRYRRAGDGSGEGPHRHALVSITPKKSRTCRRLKDAHPQAPARPATA